MDTSGHLDWLAVTFPEATRQSELFPKPIAYSQFKIVGIGPHGYATMSKNEQGIIVLSEGKPEQGVHVIMSGEPLALIRETGITDRELCLNALAYDGKASRIDVAINIFDTALVPRDMIRAYSEGRVRTRAKTGTHIEKLKTPEETLYIGTRASNRFFRAYDKGAELHDERAWLRLELECKSLVAKAMITTLAIEDNTRQVINAAMRAFVDFPDLPEYQLAVAKNDIRIPMIPRKMGNTLRWLLETVAPALARYQYNHPQDEIEQAFLIAWRLSLKMLSERDKAPDEDV